MLCINRHARGRWNGLSGNARCLPARLPRPHRSLAGHLLSRHLDRSRRRAPVACPHGLGAAAGCAAADSHGGAARLGHHPHPHDVAARHARHASPLYHRRDHRGRGRAKIFVALPINILEGILGLFIIVATWLPRLGRVGGERTRFVVLGFGTTFLGMFVSATGTLLAPLIAGTRPTATARSQPSAPSSASRTSPSSWRSAFLASRSAAMCR